MTNNSRYRPSVIILNCPISNNLSIKRILRPVQNIIAKIIRIKLFKNMETSQLKNEIETIFLRENEEKIFSYWEFLTCITGELTCPPWQMVKRLP